MKLRSQIVLRVAAVLGVFAAASAVVQVLAVRVVDRVAGLAEHHLPLARILYLQLQQMDEYEADLRRLLDSPPADANSASAARASLEGLAGHIRENLTRMEALLRKAVEDPRNDIEDRLHLAQVSGALGGMQQTLGNFLDTGDRSLAAWAGGDAEEARRIAAGLERVDDRVTAELVRNRDYLRTLIEDGIEQIRAHLHALMQTGRLLFLLACGLGLGLGFSLARRLAGRLLTLQTAVDAVTAGRLDVALPAAAPDEVGALTRGFDGLVGRLRDEQRLSHTFGRFLDPAIDAEFYPAKDYHTVYHGEILQLIER